MKKMKLLFLIILIIIICVSLFPHKFYMTDGGSYGYTAILYKITYWRKGKDLYPNAERGVSLHIFPCFDFYWPEE